MLSIVHITETMLTLFFASCVLVLTVLPSAHARNKLPHDFCPLPAKFGYKGSTKFVEQCENLDIFTDLPVPGGVFQKYGIHPIVCCPETNKIPIRPICFPTDIGCAASRDNDQADHDRRNGKDPKLSLEDCSAYYEYWGNTTQCVNLKDCPGIFQKPFNPSATKNPVNAKLCGWDDNDKALKICCPSELLQQKPRPVIQPRFPGHQCEDKVKQCQLWKNNGGCSLDTDFNIEADYNVSSSLMFDFMTGACMKACGRCGEKGCRDEHPDCKGWARKGFCVTRARFMAHTCRESCGVCGFLSEDDDGDQIVGKDTYTGVKSEGFDCGRYNETSSTRISKKSTIKRSGLPDILSSLSAFHSIPQAIESFPVSSISRPGEVDSAYVVPKPEVLKFCGATLISDRWLITAAHCYDDFGGQFYKQPVKVKIATIRNDKEAEETIEIKSVYIHPHYSEPDLYNDIALLELTRRVEYNWDQYGDSPMCLDREGRNDGKEAIIQGFGRTVEGTVGDLKQVRVTVINNTRCRQMLAHNASRSSTVQEKIRRSFPKGFNGNVLCAQGISDEDGIIRNSCQGDGGAPLFVKRDDGRYKLVGIVSGGIGCGKGLPGWFTKVEPFTAWIDCIVEKSKVFKIQERIERECQNIANEVENVAFDGDIFAKEVENVTFDGDNFAKEVENVAIDGDIFTKEVEEEAFNGDELEEEEASDGEELKENGDDYDYGMFKPDKVN